VTIPSHGAPRVFPGRALLLISIGVVLLIVFGVAACRSAEPPDTGAPAVSALASASPSQAAPAPVPSYQDGALPRADDADPPLEMKVPALDLDATVSAVGVDPRTGDFDVPPSVDRVGWYRFGPGLSADAGSIVIAGHVDSAAQGKGAFFKLGSMSPGDRITLTGADGDDRVFEVVGRERYAKTKIPLDKYFARDGKLRLTLITCGGPFDAKTRHYRDNVVVTAAPV
jgi:hypothetical protein